MINQPGLRGKEMLGKHSDSGHSKRKVIKAHLHLNIKKHFEVLPDEIPLS